MTRARFDEIANMNREDYAKFSRNRANDAEMDAWYRMHREMEEKEVISLDLLDGKTSEEVSEAHGEMLKKKETSYNNGVMTPAACKMSDALFELTDELRLFEGAVELMKSANKGSLVDQIATVHKTPIEYAECGCCIERGGHTVVSLKDGSSFEFGNTGTLLTEEVESVGFKWLKLGRNK